MSCSVALTISPCASIPARRQVVHGVLHHPHVRVLGVVLGGDHGERGAAEQIHGPGTG
jgi:hypothetical protein